MDSFDKPFQSGDGLCYPIYAKNYYKTQTTPMFGGRKTKKSQKGGNTIGNYSQPSTPSDYPGNAYLSSSNERNALTGSGVPQQMNPLTESFLNSNMGIAYATQAGGGRRKNKRGGVGANEFNGSAGVMNQQNNQNSGTLKRAEKQQSGGKNIVQEEMYVAPTKVLSASAPSQGVYPIVSGGRKKGGNPDAASIPLDITESFTSMMSGGRYKKYSKKGGNNLPPGLIEALQAQIGTQPGATMGTQPGATMGMQPGATMGMQPGATMGMQPGATMGMQPGAMPGIQTTMQPAVQPVMQQVMSGGRYKKYSKKGGNYIYTPGANFSSQPAEIATQMDPLAQAQHTPKGGFAMKNLSGVDAQMAASGSIMSGGRKKSSRTLKGGVSDFATTLSSRGPINYPDQPSADRFRYFNKTGTYIPNSQLQYAAAPISTGYEADSNPYPMAYNDYIGGAKKKAAPKKKAPAKKKVAPKKKAPAKKKPASAKKKKSASDKKKK